MNVANDLMNSLAFFIRHDHHDAIAETHCVLFIRFLLARYFHLLASVFRQCCQKSFDSFKRPTHVSLSPFYKGFRFHVLRSFLHITLVRSHRSYVAGSNPSSIRLNAFRYFIHFSTLSQKNQGSLISIYFEAKESKEYHLKQMSRNYSLHFIDQPAIHELLKKRDAKMPDLWFTTCPKPFSQHGVGILYQESVFAHSTELINFPCLA